MNDTKTIAPEIKQRAQEILTTYNLDFEIEKVPLVGYRTLVDESTGIVDVEEIESEYVGLLNTQTGEIINAVKNGYVPAQNRNFIELA